MPKIFISYRRDDSIAVAGRVYDRLERHFGKDSVFMDVDAIPIGVDFRQHLTEAVAACDVLVVIIGAQWISISQNGQRRLDDARDFVRIEIEAALQRGISVVPILVGAVVMPREDELPDVLKPLTYRNGLKLDLAQDFHPHVDRLIRGLERLGAPSAPPATKPTSPIIVPKQKLGILDCTGPDGTDVATVQKAQKECADILGLPVLKTLDLGGGVKLEMLLVPPGKFMMGSADTEKDRSMDETLHEVELTQPIYLGKFPVTCGQFAQFVRDTNSAKDFEGGAYVWTGSKWQKDPNANWRKPGFEQTSNHPVVCASWDDATKFYAWASKQSAADCRLPTEAEWEYACRAGTRTAYHFGNGLTAKQANFNMALKRTSEVGSFHAANGLGLHDMHGNVWEWCMDFYDENYYVDSEMEDPVCNSGSLRVYRGGGWDYGPRHCLSAYRGGNLPGIRFSRLGFRLALVPSGAK